MRPEPTSVAHSGFLQPSPFGGCPSPVPHGLPGAGAGTPMPFPCATPGLPGSGAPALPSKVVHMGPPVKVGQAVQVRRGGGSQWFLGHITNILGGGNCSVQYEDGVEEAVPWSMVRTLQVGPPSGMGVQVPTSVIQGSIPNSTVVPRSVSVHVASGGRPVGVGGSGVQVPVSVSVQPSSQPPAQRVNSTASGGSGCAPPAADMAAGVPAMMGGPGNKAVARPHVEPIAQQPQLAVAPRGLSGQLVSPALVEPPALPLAQPPSPVLHQEPPSSPPAPQAPEPVPPPPRAVTAAEGGDESGEESDNSSCSSKCDRTQPSSWWKPSVWIKPLTNTSPSNLLYNMKSSFTSMVENLTEVQVDMDFSPLQPNKPPSLNSLSNEYSEDAIRTATRDFDKENLLGSGACGSVYKGTMADGTEVAVKVLYSHDFSGFEDEVRVLSRFRHPNLVILMGFSRHADTGARSLVYEYLSGGDLSSQLKQSRKGDKPMPAAKRLAVALDAASGLSHMHNARPRAFHRDIKSANILLDKNGTAKMADFGLARVSSSAQHKVNAASGTPGYACPEYLRTGVVTEGSEAHSFGMLLLELLTGIPPAVVQPNGPEKLLFPFKHFERDIEKAVAMADASAGWEESVAQAVAELAFHCIDPKPENRPRFLHLVEILRWMQDPTSKVCLESLQEKLNMVSPSCPQQTKEKEAPVAHADAGILRCLHAQGVNLQGLGLDLLHISLPAGGEELIVGRNRQTTKMWSTLVPEESLKGMISREHFKVVAQQESVQEGNVTHHVVSHYVTCLSNNGMIVNTDTIRRDSSPRRLEHGDVLGLIDAKDAPGSEHMPFLAFEVNLSGGQPRQGEEPRLTLPGNPLAVLETQGPHVNMELSREERQLYLCSDHTSEGKILLRIGRDRQHSFWRRVLRPEYYLGGSWAFMAKDHFEIVAQPSSASGRPLGGDEAAEAAWRFRVRVLALTGLTINHSVVYACGNEQDLKPGDVLTVDASELTSKQMTGAEPSAQRGLQFIFNLATGASTRPPCSAAAQAIPSRQGNSRPSKVERSAASHTEEAGVMEWKSKVSVPPLRFPAPTHSGWEVQTENGWEPWHPGVAFVGKPGEEIRFHLGTFDFKASFSSADEGVQINTVTHKERLLRRMRGAGRDVATDVPDTQVSGLAASQSELTSCQSVDDSAADSLRGRAAGVLQVPVAVEHED